MKRVLVGAGVVAAIVAAAGIAPSLSLLVALTLVVSVALFVAPKQALVAIGVFLLLQTVLVNLAGGLENPLGLTLHRLHEGFAVAAVLRIAYFLRAERGTGMRRWLWITAFFVAAGIVSGLVARVPLTTLALGAFLALKFEIFFFLAWTIRWSERDCARIVRAALWLSPVFLASGLLMWLFPLSTQRLFREGHGFDFVRGDFTAMNGILSHPGVFGWAMAVIGCYAVATLLSGESRQRAGATTSLAASVLGILGSLRRKPLIALPIVAVYAVLRFGRGRRRWAVLAAFMVLAGSSAWLVRDRIEAIYTNTLEYVDPTGPTAPRLLLYAVGGEIANDYFPLGAGFGRFGGYASVIDYSPLYDRYGLSDVAGLTAEDPEWISDAYWPHVAAEAGWFGALAIAALYLMLGHAVAKVAFAARDPATKALALGAGLALLEALAESVAGPVFEVTLFALVVALPLGITLSRVAATADTVSAGIHEDDVVLPLPGEPVE